MSFRACPCRRERYSPISSHKQAPGMSHTESKSTQRFPLCQESERFPTEQALKAGGGSGLHPLHVYYSTAYHGWSVFKATHNQLKRIAWFLVYQKGKWKRWKSRTARTVPLKAQTVQGGASCYFQACVGVRRTGPWKQLFNNRMCEVSWDSETHPLQWTKGKFVGAGRVQCIERFWTGDLTLGFEWAAVFSKALLPLFKRMTPGN